jgi:hypothetical protein
MRTHHLLVAALVLLPVVSASSQEQLALLAAWALQEEQELPPVEEAVEPDSLQVPTPLMVDAPYGYQYGYAGYQKFATPSFCCGTHLHAHRSAWAGRVGSHCHACGHHQARVGLLGHLRANRRGCHACGATSCCDTGCSSCAVQKAGPVQKGSVQKAWAPPKQVVSHRAWAVQKAPMVQKAPVVQKGFAVQKGAVQKADDCCAAPTTWGSRLHRCGRLHGWRGTAVGPHHACCAPAAAGMISSPYYDYQPSELEMESEDDGSILVPPQDGPST